MSGNWNEYNVNILTSIHWRASLVPAAAVIPAQVAYIKFVAVKKLVVEDGLWMARSASLHVSGWLGPFVLVNAACGAGFLRGPGPVCCGNQEHLL